MATPKPNVVAQAKQQSLKGLKLLAEARLKEFSLITPNGKSGNFLEGYRSREDVTSLPPGVMVVGSQNVLTNTYGRISLRKGYTLDGQGATTGSTYGIAASIDWQSHTGAEQHLRSFQPSPFGGQLQVRYVYPVGSTAKTPGTVLWIDLVSGLANTVFRGCDYWDAANSQSRLLMVNGTYQVYEWSGAVAPVASVSNATGIIAYLTQGPYDGTIVAPTNGGSGYVAGDTLTVSGGTGATLSVNGVSAFAITTLNPSPVAAGSNYSVGDVVTIGTGTASVLITGVSSGAVTSFSVSSQGSGYPASGLPYTLSTTNQSNPLAAGFTVSVTGVASGVVNSVQLLTPGSGYAATTESTTGGTGTGVTVTVGAVATNSITFQGSYPQTVLTSYGFYPFASSVYVGSSTAAVGLAVQYTNVVGLSIVGLSSDPTTLGVSAGDPIVQVPRTTTTASIAGFPLGYSVDGITSYRNQVYYGSQTSSTVLVSQVNNYQNVNFSLPRLVGQGASYTMDGPWRAFVPQESFVYTSAAQEQWYQTVFTLSSDLTRETFAVQRLKTGTLQGAQSQEWVSNGPNDVFFLSNEPVVNTLGRVVDVFGTPQVTDLSHPIVNDMASYNFSNGSILSFQKYVYVALPASNRVLVYNLTNPKNNYWEAPQVLPIGRFSVIYGQLYGHSALANESYRLFSGWTDNGHAVSASATFAYQDFGVSAAIKYFNRFFAQGYIGSNTTLSVTNLFNYQGTAGSQSFQITGTEAQAVGLTPDSSSLGKSSLGKNPLGGDTATVQPGATQPMFRTIKGYPRTKFYEYQPSFSSEGIGFQWELLRFGPALDFGTDLPVEITN